MAAIPVGQAGPSVQRPAVGEDEVSKYESDKDYSQYIVNCFVDFDIYEAATHVFYSSF